MTALDLNTVREHLHRSAEVGTVPAQLDPAVEEAHAQRLDAQLAAAEARAVADRRVLDAAEALSAAVADFRRDGSVVLVHPDLEPFLAAVDAAVDARRALTGEQKTPIPSIEIEYRWCKECEQDIVITDEGALVRHRHPREAASCDLLGPWCSASAAALTGEQAAATPADRGVTVVTLLSHGLLAEAGQLLAAERVSTGGTGEASTVDGDPGFCTHCGAHLAGEHFGSCPVADPQIAQPRIGGQ